MCSTPKTASVDTTPAETVSTPTAADASVSKASTNTRNKASSLASRNIKTSSRGLTEEENSGNTKKKGLLGE